MDEDWDYLLVLDACRYNYFEKVYDDYFEGELEEIISPGTETSEWCRKVFTEKYDDVVYVSGNPRINSSMEIKGFDSKTHFHEVVDVWDWGWDSERGTVLPDVINDSIFDSARKYPDKRIIGHYMQPHAPYLSLGPLDVPENKGVGKVDPSRKSKIRKLGSWFTRWIGQKHIWKVREFFGREPNSPIYSVLKKVGEDRLKGLYMNNLKKAMDGIAEVRRNLDGKIVVTSDHGELLGEGGNFGHYANTSEEALRNVPWFYLSEVRENEFESVTPNRSKLRSKIESLKQSGEI